ncbi:MAG: GNAT family N-acetyltransferase [Bacteroidota bacterium]
MPPLLATKRLHLRTPQLSDETNNYALSSNPNVMRFITGGKIQTPKEARADLERRIRISQTQAKKGLGYWFADEKDTGHFVGWFVLNYLDATDEIEIGYRLLEEKWNMGYATEGSKAILHYAFQELQLPEIVAVALPANIASTKVMQKLGMQFMKEAVFYGATCAYYRISMQDWSNA